MLKTRGLLGFRAEKSLSYTMYASGFSTLQTGASHRVLSIAVAVFLGVFFYAFSPSIVHAQASPTCLVKMSRAVPNMCKGGTLAADEFNVRNLPDWSDNLGEAFNGGACPGVQACAVKKGDALCAWFVDTSNAEGVQGTDFAIGIGCFPQDQCKPGKIFKADGATQIPPDGNPCVGPTVCCIPEKGAKGTTEGSGAGGAGTGSVNLPDPLGGVSLPELAGNIIRTFTGVAGAIALLMFVWGGVKWIISGGKEGDVKQAKDILRNASIGLILIFGAYFFVAAIIQAILSNPQ